MIKCWTMKAPMPMPFKADGTAAVYNNKLYIFGGYYESSNDVRSETFVFDPIANSWERKADMPTARWGPLAVEADGLIYVFGGSISTYVPTLVVEVYNPQTDSWTKKNDMPAGFEHGLMGVRYKDKIHLFCNKLHYEYDIATDTYISKKEIPQITKWGTCAIVDTEIFIIGGVVRTEGKTDKGMEQLIIGISANQAYNLETDSWKEYNSCPSSGYGMTRENPVIDGNIYVVCGYSPPLQGYGLQTPSPVVSSHCYCAGFRANTFIFNPKKNSWKTKSSCYYARDGVECGVVNGKLYIIGGRNTVAEKEKPIHGLPYCEEYDPIKEE